MARSARRTHHKPSFVAVFLLAARIPLLPIFAFSTVLVEKIMTCSWSILLAGYQRPSLSRAHDPPATTARRRRKRNNGLGYARLPPEFSSEWPVLVGFCLFFFRVLLEKNTLSVAFNWLLDFKHIVQQMFTLSTKDGWKCCIRKESEHCNQIWMRLKGLVPIKHYLNLVSSRKFIPFSRLMTEH